MSYERGAEGSQLTLAKYHTLREAMDGLPLWVAPTHTVYGYICCLLNVNSLTLSVGKAQRVPSVACYFYKNLLLQILSIGLWLVAQGS